jgi:hypothetical protein
LLALVPLTSLFIGVRLPSETRLTLPGVPAELPGAAMMLFSALPWTLGGGMLGPAGAAILGGLSGLLRGFWDTHSLFTSLEFALLGVLFQGLFYFQVVVWGRLSPKFYPNSHLSLIFLSG